MGSDVDVELSERACSSIDIGSLEYISEDFFLPAEVADRVIKTTIFLISQKN